MFCVCFFVGLGFNSLFFNLISVWYDWWLNWHIFFWFSWLFWRRGVASLIWLEGNSCSSLSAVIRSVSVKFGDRIFCWRCRRGLTHLCLCFPCLSRVVILLNWARTKEDVLSIWCSNGRYSCICIYVFSDRGLAVDPMQTCVLRLYSIMCVARLIKDGRTGRPKGFGFVSYASKDEAQRALNAMNGRVWIGFLIT